MAPHKPYVESVNLLAPFRTKKVLQHNPTVSPEMASKTESVLTLIEFDTKSCRVLNQLTLQDIKPESFDQEKWYWLNVEVLHPEVVEEIAHRIGLHPLITEDILSRNQRPKADEIDNLLTCVLHMLFFNSATCSIESEQVSMVLTRNLLVSFQDDGVRDVFDPIRQRLHLDHARFRQHGVDYLLYGLLDTIVDQYFVVLDHLAQQIEQLEEHISRGDSEDYSMNQINDLRKEIMLFKRYAHPVREMINGILRSETAMIETRNFKYFKDIYDHSIQANDLCETYRDVITNIRDLYINQINLRMNEVMKFLAIVTALLAPATVIGGIFGMNFDRIPYLHNQHGFWLATAAMIVVPIFMLFYFRRKKWF